MSDTSPWVRPGMSEINTLAATALLTDAALHSKLSEDDRSRLLSAFGRYFKEGFGSDDEGMRQYTDNVAIYYINNREPFTVNPVALPFKDVVISRLHHPFKDAVDMTRQRRVRHLQRSCLKGELSGDETMGLVESLGRWITAFGETTDMQTGFRVSSKTAHLLDGPEPLTLIPALAPEEPIKEELVEPLSSSHVVAEEVIAPLESETSPEQVQETEPTVEPLITEVLVVSEQASVVGPETEAPIESVQQKSLGWRLAALGAMLVGATLMEYGHRRKTGGLILGLGALLLAHELSVFDDSTDESPDTVKSSLLSRAALLRS